MAIIRKKDIIADLLLQDIFADQPKYKVQDFVEDLFQSIADKVAAGDQVVIAGFGKFEKFEKTKNGQPTGTFTPKFRPAKAFKDSVNAK